MPRELTPHNAQWDALHLLSPSQLCKVDLVVQYENTARGTGVWFYAPEEELPHGGKVIYHGVYSTTRGPASKNYTWAVIYSADEAEDYFHDLEMWKSIC